MTPDLHVTEAGHKRIRTLAACDQCRKRKLKCNGGQPCTTCERRSVRCTTLVQTPRTNNNSPSGTTTPNNFSRANSVLEDDLTTLLPDGDTLRLLLDAYFHSVHPVSCNNFLHHGSLMESLERGKAPQLLLLAVCGVSAKFIPDHTIQDLGRKWIETAKTRLSGALDVVSMTNVALLHTMALNHIQDGNFVPAWNFIALAFRIAVQLKMNKHEVGADASRQRNFARQESRIRLMWAVYVLHCLLLCDELHSNENFLQTLPLPCNVWNFMQGLPSRTLCLSEPFSDPERASATNPCAYLIKIVIVRSEIMRFNQSLVSMDQTYPWQGGSKFHNLAKSLENFRQTMRSNLSFEVRQMHNFRSSRQLDMLLMIHTWFHHCNCQLYGLWIENHPRASTNFFLSLAPTEFALSCTMKSILHAKQMSRLVEKVLEQDPQHDFIDVWLAISMLDSAQVLIAAALRQITPEEKQEMIAIVRRYPFLVAQTPPEQEEENLFDDGYGAYEQEEREWSDMLRGLNQDPTVSMDIFDASISNGQSEALLGNWTF